MDAKDDLILGVFANYSFSWLEAYMVSITRSKFRGRKVLIVWNIESEVRKKLIEYGFELVEVPPQTKNEVVFAADFFRVRDRLAYEFLKEHYQEFRFVFWMDIRDLVFQSDPSVWMEKNLGSSRIVVASECIRIKDEQCNDGWVKAIFDPATYLRIREHEVLNAGTFAGYAENMRDVFFRLCEIADHTTEVAEQAALNFVLREPEFESVTKIPRLSEGFAAVGYGFGNELEHVWTDQVPVLNKETGMLYPQGKVEPFAIVHQYDRNKAWAETIASHYTVGLVPPPPRVLRKPRFSRRLPR
jgi:hypothetical protein